MRSYLRRFTQALAASVLFCPGFTASFARGEDKSSSEETVLFPFDDHALPFSKGLVLTLMPGKKSATAPSLGTDPKHPGTPVMPIGKEGDPDFPRAYFCGTILKIDNEYRMWYSGFD